MLNKIIALFAKSRKRTRIPDHAFFVSQLSGKRGLEIGGPSWIFSKRGPVPVYSLLAGLDGCNFDRSTVWEGNIKEGPGNYEYEKGRPGGYQYIREAADLRGIETGTYDAVLSSHCIEHVANPFRALTEWLRVLKPGGFFLLVAPHRDGTFDHRRPVTAMEHLVQDRDRSVAEDDLTHLDEILELHDITMDPPAGDRESFRQRSLRNSENRCLHHHVFDTGLIVRIIDSFRLQILNVHAALPYHIIVLARKPSGNELPDNSVYLFRAANYRQESPFPSDRDKT